MRGEEEKGGHNLHNHPAGLHIERRRRGGRKRRDGVAEGKGPNGASTPTRDPCDTTLPLALSSPS